MTKPKRKPVEQRTPDELFRSAPHVFRDEMADAGNVMGLFQTIVASPAGRMADQPEFNRLDGLVRHAARTNPLGLVRYVLQEGISTTACLALRTEYEMQTKLARHGSTSPSKGPSPLSAEITDRLAPRLQGLREHLMALAGALEALDGKVGAATAVASDSIEAITAPKAPVAVDDLPPRKKPIPPDLVMPEDPTKIPAFLKRAIKKYTTEELYEYGVFSHQLGVDIDEQYGETLDRATVVARQLARESA